MSDTTTALTKPTRNGKWQCGFCSGGTHDRCIGGIMNQGKLLVCGCKAHPTAVRCVACGNTHSEELNGWACANPADCADTIAARSAANPLRKELETVRALGGAARRAELDRRTRAAIMAAVSESGIDEQLGHDNPSEGRRGPRAPRTPREPRKTSGTCICGCNGTTKGGRFVPGHDMKLKSALKKAILAGDESARQRMIELGWEKFVPVAA